MKINSIKKITAAILCTSLIFSLAACSKKTKEPENTTIYIEAPYSVDEELNGPTEYLEPVFYKNENGPVIGVTLVGVINEDGFYFKDSNNNQKLDPYEDWRLDIDERISDLLPRLSGRQKLGILVNQLTMNPNSTTKDNVYDSSGNVILGNLIDVTPNALDMEMVTGGNYSNSTGEILTDESRSGVVRIITDGTVSALWVNAMNMTCEYDAAAKGFPAIPMTVISNPQNEITDMPSSQGMAAAVMGDISNGGDYSLMEKFANLDREIWNAKGISRMYGPQIDLITDPRWPRNNTTYTEVPEVMAGIATALVKGYQGENGVNEESVALIMKHFPGDGAAYNGFESHNAIGKYRIYSTEGSMENYQLVGFQAAIDAGVAGIMPGYSVYVKDNFYGNKSQDYRGVKISSENVGNAYSSEILQTLLRDTMGFEGLVNTDSGVLNANRQYGKENISEEERFADLINAGCDVISNQFSGMDWNTAYTAYNDGLFDEGAVNRADTNTLKIMFEQGLFENPYKDVEESEAIVTEKTEELQELANEINLKSVVLLKNSDNTLPLKDKSLKIYVKALITNQDNWTMENLWKDLFKKKGFEIADSPEEANIAFIDVVPGGLTTSNTYMGVLDLVEELEVDEYNYPESPEKNGNKITITTLEGIDEIAEIADNVHKNGGKVISSIDINNPWILTNLEPYCDGLIASFSTSMKARTEVLTGEYNPAGKLPVTLPSCNEVISVYETTDELGNAYETCVSPNDVPGYDKDKYMDEDVLEDSPSGSYAYQDTDGNLYVSWYGLNYETQ